MEGGFDEGGQQVLPEDILFYYGFGWVALLLGHGFFLHESTDHFHEHPHHRKHINHHPHGLTVNNPIHVVIGYRLIEREYTPYNPKPIEYLIDYPQRLIEILRPALNELHHLIQLLSVDVGG